MAKVKYRLPDIGDRHGRLTVYGEAIHENNTWFIVCVCDCGTIIKVRHQHWVSGHTRSCGCLLDDNRAKNLGDYALPDDPHRVGMKTQYRHGLSKSRIYITWGNMISRCTNPKNKSWWDYGGRGITVCEEWKTFIAFMEWATNNGYSDTLEIDRIDNEKGYSPDNCRWVTHAENCANRRLPGTSRPIADGKRQCNTCNLWVPVKKFAKDTEDPLGIRKTCADCQHNRDQIRNQPQQDYNYRTLTIFGEQKSSREWSRDPRCEVSYSTLYYRITHGWEPAEAIKTRK